MKKQPKQKKQQEWNHVITITPEAAKKIGVKVMKSKQTEKKIKSRSFFDFSEEEQKEIFNQAADDSNKAQQELMKTEEQKKLDRDFQALLLTGLPPDELIFYDTEDKG